MKWIIGIATAVALVVMAVAIWFKIGDIVQQLLMAAGAFIVSAVLPALLKLKTPEEYKLENARRRQGLPPVPTKGRGDWSH